jgi:hypothetical protein
MSSCPICGANATLSHIVNRVLVVVCPRCGAYHITHEASSALPGVIREVPIRWAITSHALRRTGSTFERPFLVTQSWLASVWETDRLPNPQQQADYLVIYLGDTARVPDQWVTCLPVNIAGLVGTGDDPVKNETSGFAYLVEHLSAEHLITARSNMSAGQVDYRLTFRGWARFEDLRMARGESNVAFMAMGYSNPDVAQAFSQFRIALSGLKIDLRRLDTEPKSGLIDLRMRVDLRAAKFAVVDLTDENRGAYWEGGFAEGCGKKVYYLCEATKFETVKSHFDTEHLFTVKWDLSNMEKATDDLTAAIQNDFPEYAMALKP